MSTKQTVEKYYKYLEEDYDDLKKCVSPKDSNYESVYKNVTQLKTNMAKFADNFDKDIDKVTSLDFGILSRSKCYEDIRDGLIKPIVDFAKCDDHFVYVRQARCGESLADAKKRVNRYIISRFDSKYLDLESNFRESRDLIRFFEENSEIFSPSSSKYRSWETPVTNKKSVLINKDTDRLVRSTFDIVAKKLKLAEREILAKDDEYFDSETYALGDAGDGAKIFPIVSPTGSGKCSPLPSEVKQAKIGDCFLMSALMALSKTKKNAKAIKNCFIQGTDEIEKRNDIIIRFFCKAGEDVVPIKITIDKRKVFMPESIKDGALWPKLIEKAYAVYRKKGLEPVNFKTDLEGGLSKDVMFAITGDKSYYDSDPPEKEDVIITIKKKLEIKHAVTCGFKREVSVKDQKSGENVIIYPEHDYAIVGINEEKNYIRLINPWKNSGRTKRLDEKALKEGGHIAMSYEDFRRYSDLV